MPDEFQVSSVSQLGELIKQHLTVLSHDTSNLKDSIRSIETRLAGLAEREDIAKIELQLDRLASEKLFLVRKEEFSDIKAQVALLTLDKDFINGVKGTLSFIKVFITSIGGLIVLFVSTFIVLHQQTVGSLSDASNRIFKVESQIPSLIEFKREVEEQGSPILRSLVKDVDGLRTDLKANQTELRTLSSAILDERRGRERPDIEDAKQ